MATVANAANANESFLRRYIFSTDHKMIAKQYLITSWLMGLFGGVLAILIRVQLGWPNSGLIDASFYLKLMTIHGTVMIFFFLTPLLVGAFGNFFIPLQIGARDMAFPFLNMLSFWTFFVSCILILASFFVGDSLTSGWTAYPPLSMQSGVSQDLWLYAIFLDLVALTMGGINYIATVINLRTRGMGFWRLPLTVWAMFITAVIGFFAFPALIAAGILLWMDRVFGTAFFAPVTVAVGDVFNISGGEPLLWQHLFWFFGHPEVYIVIVPAMGIVSEVLSTNARKPIFGYRFMVASMSVIAFLSLLVWGHHMFTSGMHPLLGGVFMATTTIIAVPSAIKVFNWVSTLYGGSIRFTSAMLFSIGFISLFVTGGLTGIIVGNAPADLYVHDTYFVVAHFHLVMGAAALFGAIAATYHWFPKMFGRMMDETLGRWHFVLSMIGIYGAFFPMHFLGLAGVPRRYFSFDLYDYMQDIGGLNVFISVMAFIASVAQVLFIYNFFVSMRYGKLAPANPWGSNTLEWSVKTPGHGNFGPELPVVYRGPYEYSRPDLPAGQDHLPQWIPTQEAAGESDRDNEVPQPGVLVGPATGEGAGRETE